MSFIFITYKHEDEKATGTCIVQIIYLRTNVNRKGNNTKINQSYTWIVLLEVDSFRHILIRLWNRTRISNIH